MPTSETKKEKGNCDDFDGREYREGDGVIHINLLAIEEKREMMRKQKADVLYGVENRPVFHIPTPKSWASKSISWDLRSVEASRLTLHDFDVKEGVVMNVVRVIMVQQYTIQKGLATKHGHVQTYTGARAHKGAKDSGPIISNVPNPKKGRKNKRTSVCQW